jgi:predicted DNA-binding protein (UPF0251 family)
LSKLKQAMADTVKAANRRSLKAASEAAGEVKLPSKDAISIPALDINNDLLLTFTQTEKDIVVCYFEDLSQSHKQIATKLGIAYQTVTALLQSKRFQILYAKVFDSILPIEALNAIRIAMRRGDTKVTLEVARSYGLIKPETIDVNTNSKPVEDTQAISLLKTLGDSLAKKNTSDS